MTTQQTRDENPTQATFEEYSAYFPTLKDCVVFEERCLSIARKLLPSHARVVLEGGEATPEYWAWLRAEATANPEEDAP